VETCSSNMTAVPSGATSYSLTITLPWPSAVSDSRGVPVSRVAFASGHPAPW
jgi:hypothetical protein